MSNKIVLSLVAALVAAPALAGEAPTVKLGGRMDIMAGSVNESRGYRNTNPADNTQGDALHKAAIVNDTKLDINIDGKLSTDAKYGGFIRLHADTSTATNGESTIGDKTMVYFQHDRFGRIEAGNMPGAGGMFEMDVVFMNKGTWGVEGFWSQWVQDKTKNFSNISNTTLVAPGVNLTTYLKANGSNIPDTRGAEFITSPNLLSNYSGNHYSDAPKVNFFTKPHKSVTLGVAYIPDMDSTGTIVGVAPKNGAPADADRPFHPASFRHIFSGGIMVDHKINNDYTVKASLVGEVGKAKSNTLRNLKAMEAGLALSYKHFKVTGSYGDWFKSFTLKKPASGAKQGGKYFTLGFGQQINKIGYSVTYLNSRKAGGLESLTTSKLPLSAEMVADKKSNKLSVVSLDVDYQLAPGFLPYAGATFFDFKEAKGARDRGQMFILGTRLLF